MKLLKEGSSPLWLNGGYHLTLKHCDSPCLLWHAHFSTFKSNSSQWYVPPDCQVSLRNASHFGGSQYCFIWTPNWTIPPSPSTIIKQLITNVQQPWKNSTFTLLFVSPDTYRICWLIILIHQNYLKMISADEQSVTCVKPNWTTGLCFRCCKSENKSKH